MMTPKCYGCDRKARKGSLFCSQKCAADYAEELLLGNDEVWCPATEQWHAASDQCPGQHVHMHEWASRAATTLTPRYKGDTEPVPAYTEAEFNQLRNKLENVAWKIWRADLEKSGGDRGTCVLGAGFAVWVRKKRARYAKSRLLVAHPGQSDCAWCKAGTEQFLKDAGVEGLHFEYGTMD
jgi:hypothetical protein